MSDLGSEELEEEGENDLGVRASDQGGTSGVRRSSGAGGVGTRGPERLGTGPHRPHWRRCVQEVALKGETP